MMVSLGPDATGGPATDVCVYNAVGSIDFVLDANGWFGSSLTSTPLGAQFQAIGPTRVCDTRAGSAYAMLEPHARCGRNALHRRCGCRGRSEGRSGRRHCQSHGSCSVHRHIPHRVSSRRHSSSERLGSQHRGSGAPQPGCGRPVAPRSWREYSPLQRQWQRECRPGCGGLVPVTRQRTRLTPHKSLATSRLPAQISSGVNLSGRSLMSGIRSCSALRSLSVSD